MKRTAKIFLASVIFIIILIVTFNLLFGLLIKTQIKNLSNQNIQLDYKSSKTRILSGYIEFSDAVLTFNDISIDSGSAVFIKNISFEKFAISRLNLKALLFERSFNIQKVTLKDPKIDFLKDTSITHKELLFTALSPKAVSSKSQSAPFSFEIGELEIEQGSFQLIDSERTDFSIGKFNLKLLDIGMEDLKVLSREAPDLNANFNIRFGIYDIKKELEDGAEILIDSIVYKKDKKLFETGGVRLNKLKSSSMYSKSELTLFADLISVNGFNLSHFLSSQDVKFNRLTISNTEIIEKINYRSELKTSEQEVATKSQFLFTFINAFITDTLQVQNFNYKAKDVKTDSTDFIKNFNLSLYSIKFDSNFIGNKGFLTPIEKSRLESGPIDMHMPEFGIDFSCNSLAYSGPDKEQKIIGLSVDKYTPMFSDEEGQNHFQFRSDSLLISGLQEKEWLDSSVVEFSLYLINPEFTGTQISFDGSTKRKKTNIMPNKLVLNEIKLLNGKVDIQGSSNELIQLEELNFEGYDLGINSRSSSSGTFFQWQNIFLSFHNAKFLVPEKLQVQLNQALINNNNIDLFGIEYSDKKIVKNDINSRIQFADSSRLFVNEIKLDNINLKALINQKHLLIDKLIVSQPEYFHFMGVQRKQSSNKDSITPLSLYNKINNILPDYFGIIDIKNFDANGANILYQMKTDNLKLAMNLSAAMQKIYFSADTSIGQVPQLKIENYKFCVSDFSMDSEKMSFGTESFCYNNTDDKLIILHSHAHSKKTDRDGAVKSNTQYSISFPVIELWRPDFTPQSGGPLSFERLLVKDPEISIQFFGSEENPNQNATGDFSMLPFSYLDEGVNIENGKISLDIMGEKGNTRLDIESLDLEVLELYKIIGAVDHTEYNKNIFSYLDFHFKGLSLEGPGISSSVENIDYDKRTGLLSFSPINQQIFSQKDAPLFRSTINIPKVHIEHPDVMLINYEVESFGAKNLYVPFVDVVVEAEKKQEDKEEGEIKIANDNKVLRNLVGKYSFFHIDSTVFNDIGLTFHQISDSGKTTFDIERVSFLVDKLKIDSSHFDFHEKRIAKDIVFTLHDKELVTADSLYRIKINDITYYYSHDKIVVDSFEVSPMLEREAFFEKVGFQTDRMQVKFSSAIVEGIDLLEILENKKLQVTKLTLDKFKLMDHRDKHYGRKENDFKLMPKQSLFNLPFALNIDTIKVNDSFVLYGEYVDKSAEPGEIFFTNFNASIYNVSNIKKTENQNNKLLAIIDTDIMDKAKMNVNLTIPLIEDADYFWFSGKVEKTDLRHFNSMTENLFGISILRGKGGVDIPLITANYENSKGSLNFEYKKLKLAMYNRNKATLSKGLGAGLIDFMLNGVLIRSNNPAFLGKVRTGDVYAERNDQRSFFNYIWKSTMSGLTTTMGFYNKHQREEKRERKGEEKIERKDERQTNKTDQ